MSSLHPYIILHWPEYWDFFLSHSAAHIHLNTFLYHYVCGNCNHPPTFQLPRLMEGHQSVYWAASPGLLFSSLTTPELFHWASRPHIKDRLATALGYYASLLEEHKSNEILNGIILACVHVSMCACVKHRERHHMLLPRVLCALFAELLVNGWVKQHTEDEQWWDIHCPYVLSVDWLSVHYHCHNTASSIEPSVISFSFHSALFW